MDMSNCTVCASLALCSPLQGVVCPLKFGVIKGGLMLDLETLCLLESMLQRGIWRVQAGAQGGGEQAGVIILYIHIGKLSNQN